MTLSERIEAAEGPSRELDWLIAEALGWTRRQVGQVIAYYAPGDGIMRAGPPKWTASLDAAMSLVPEGWRTSISNTTGLGWFVLVCEYGRFGEAYAKATTPALALAAAALKARGL
ncbi:MAG: hypothetical protein KGL44_05455 [Sphingomonadales bacterium]|nr:hypothetical protein [Sphingomonadales bacterium]